MRVISAELRVVCGACLGADSLAVVYAREVKVE